MLYQANHSQPTASTSFITEDKQLRIEYTESSTTLNYFEKLCFTERIKHIAFEDPNRWDSFCICEWDNDIALVKNGELVKNFEPNNSKSPLAHLS